jgi:hypothetical protein
MWAQVWLQGAADPALQPHVTLQTLQEPTGDLIAPEEAADVEA